MENTNCEACGAHVAYRMTDGKRGYFVCDTCRPMVTTFFHIFRDMSVAIAEVRKTYGVA